MSKKKLSKLLALYLPYVVIGLVATNLGEAWRLAVGKELGDKIVSLMDTLPAVFSNPLPSLHPFDLFIGLCKLLIHRTHNALTVQNGHIGNRPEIAVFADYCNLFAVRYSEGYECRAEGVDIGAELFVRYALVRRIMVRLYHKCRLCAVECTALRQHILYRGDISYFKQFLFLHIIASYLVMFSLMYSIRYSLVI